MIINAEVLIDAHLITWTKVVYLVQIANYGDCWHLLAVALHMEWCIPKMTMTVFGPKTIIAAYYIDCGEIVVYRKNGRELGQNLLEEARKAPKGRHAVAPSLRRVLRAAEPRS